MDLTTRFQGKTIAIAGGAGGIGGATSRRLAAEGATVFVGDVNLDAAQEVARAIRDVGGQAMAHHVDIGDEATVAAFVEAAAQATGAIDGFYVNALDPSRSPVDSDPVDIDLGDYDYLMSVNLRGYLLCTRHAVPRLLVNGGSMLYTSSGAAYVGLPSQVTYAMGKSAIHALSRNVASRYGKEGVRSNVISPGLIFHPGVDAVMPPGTREATLKTLRVTRVGQPEDIAAMAAMLLSDDAAFVTGQVISVDGGVTMRA